MGTKNKEVVRFECRSRNVFKLSLNTFLKVRILTDAVDDITTVDDFLAVSESHILDDVNRCITALQVNTFFIL